MGLMAKLKGELVDIIEWLDDSRSTLAWRFPRHNNEIKNGAQLIVREGQRAVFVYRGALADSFMPGHYELTSENLPILSTLQGWKHGFNSPFRSEVYFINTRPITDLRWGTPSPITIRDPDFGMVQVRANGLCMVKIEEVDVFLREVIGTDSEVEAAEIAELLRQVISTAFSEMVLETGVGAIDLQGKQRELAAKLREYVQEKVDDEFGLSIPDITMNISLPDEITQAMTRGVARGVEEGGYARNIGDIDRFQQVRQSDALLAAASNEGGNAGAGLGLGLGVAMGGQLAGQFGGGQGGGGQGGPPPLSGAASYHVEVNGQQAGPYNMDQLRQAAGSGQVGPHTLVWSAGMATWSPAGQVGALAPLFLAPPPLPGAATPPPMPPQSPADAPAAAGSSPPPAEPTPPAPQG